MRIFAYLATVCLLLPLPAKGQNPVAWTLVSPRTVPVVKGRVVNVQVRATVDKGWRIYSLTQKKGGPYTMSISLVPGSAALIVPPVIAPAPQAKYDSAFRMITETYSGTPVFTIPISTVAYRGRHLVKVKIRYQACSDTYCFPPRNVLIPVTLRIISSK